MLSELYAIQDGHVRVQCAVTLNKRVIREAGRFLDRHPLGGATLYLAVTLMLLASVPLAVWGLVK